MPAVRASGTAGTVLRRTRVPLRLWLAAAYLVATRTPGLSAVQLQLQLRRRLGPARHGTARTMLHKLRRAMLRSGRDRPSGAVEVGEGCAGGVGEGRHGGSRAAPR